VGVFVGTVGSGEAVKGRVGTSGDALNAIDLHDTNESSKRNVNNVSTFIFCLEEPFNDARS
jgi:hypothetical protein